jgi:hypothetical protein
LVAAEARAVTQCDSAVLSLVALHGNCAAHFTARM